MLRYYVLFENYDQGLKLHDLLDRAGVDNRIAPAPVSARGELCCGMSLLIQPEFIEKAKEVIFENRAEYYKIAPVENTLVSRRDRYC